MPNFRVIYTRQDGGVSVVTPAQGITAEDCIARLPEGVAYEVVAPDDIPQDRTFRDAWEHDTSPAPRKIAVNLVIAKGIAHDKRRAKRATEFAPLDVEFTIPNKAAEAEAKRQTVRDKYSVIQSDIDACSTPEQLKTIIEAASL